MTKNYIEFRVYLKDDTKLDKVEVDSIASLLQDSLIDALDPAIGAPEFFTQDVTYEIVLEEK